MRYAALFSAACLMVSGCSILENDVERGYERSTLGPYPATYTTADVRIVSLRPHPISGHFVECAEPSPDVAKALASAVSLSATINNEGGGSASGAAAEAIAELAGRSTALLGLRDGLFRACEAYANGSIGDDAYALVLSRYGQLMTTLFLGQDVAASNTAANLAAINYPAGFTVGVSAGGTTGAAPSPSSGSSATSQSKSAKSSDASDIKTSSSVADSSTPAELTAPARAAYDQIAQAKLPQPSLNKLIQLASLNPADALLTQAPAEPAGHPGRVVDGGVQRAPTAEPAPTPAPPASVPAGSNVVMVTPCAAAVTCPPKSPAPAPKGQSATNSASTNTEKTTPAVMSSAEALVRMNEGYFDLDRRVENAYHLLTVACINEFDETRYLNAAYHNDWLRRQCNSINLSEVLQQLAVVQTKLAFAKIAAQTAAARAKPTPPKKLAAPAGVAHAQPAAAGAPPPPLPTAVGPAPMALPH